MASKAVDLYVIYQIIKKPIIKNAIPNNLSLFSGVVLINSNILLILDGKMAKNSPSKKKSRPKAIMSSFT